jgi:PKD repeat protein
MEKRTYAFGPMNVKTQSKVLMNAPRRGVGLIKAILLVVSGILLTLTTSAQLPSASQIADQMTIGWNVGNSLEVPGGETGWGNPVVSQQLITAVKNAGFNTLRIPCAWDSHANQSTLIIDPAWLARVKEVVDYAYANDMWVILNSHWDGGWLEENPYYSVQDEVNEKQEAYWTQIASYFQAYDEHLLFAGTNEVRHGYDAPGAENVEVQQSYVQTFVDAVRATGGNNASRTLIVQTYNTNIWHGFDYFVMPSDNIYGRLMVEVHHYDPYDFTLNSANTCIYWGSPFPQQSACSWAQESYIDNLFNQVRAKWTDNDVPVIMGEYGAIRREALGDPDAIAARDYWIEYNTAAAKENGILPVYWDNGFYGDGGLAIFNRNTGSVLDQSLLDALMDGAGVGDPNQNYDLMTSVSGSGSISLSPSGGTYSGGTQVTVTANPASGFIFLRWSGDLSGADNPATVAMNTDKTITAIFIEEGVGGTGSILAEFWTSVPGTAVSDLTGNANYPNNPSSSEQLTSLEGNTDWADNYGTRIRGFIHPAVSGTYTFWIAGDDYCDLYLSSDASPSNASRIAYVAGWTNSREWEKYASQQSASIALTAGEKYYVEVLQKEGYGGDNIAVAWQGAGISREVIPGSYLSPIEGGVANNPPIAQAIASPTSGQPPLAVSFNASASSDPDGDALSFSWNFGDGSTGSGVSPAHTYTSDGSYSATVTVSDGQLSDQATLNITVSTTPVNHAPIAQASASPTSGISPLSVSFNASASADPDGDALSFSWNFGDGSSGSGVTPGHTYSSPGNYTATVTVSDGELSDQESIAISVNDPSTPCDNPQTISIPFTFNGSGQHCWVTTTEIAYINSWNLNELTINGVDFTNTWSNNLPPAVNGQWVISYDGDFSWSHFEAPAAKSAREAFSSVGGSIKVYPNPLSGNTLFVETGISEDPFVLKIIDLNGRTVFEQSLDAAATVRLQLTIPHGVYMIRIIQNNQVFTDRLVIE